MPTAPLTLPLNPLLIATEGAPIPAAVAWLGRYDGSAGPAINLSQAVPGRAPEPVLLDAMGRAAASPEAARYGPIVGDPALRKALAADIRAAYGGDVDDGDVMITAGCNQAFFVTLLALAAAGDEIILPAPWYFNYKMDCDMLGIRAVPLMCRAEDGFVPDIATARRLITARTRAIVLITPNNPTGAVYDPATIAAFGALAREAGVRLVLDETYRDFLPEGHDGPPHAAFDDADWRGRIVHLYSFSKSCAIPGHRTGAIVAGPDFTAEAVKVMDSLQICAPRVAQIALAETLAALSTPRRAMRADFNRRATLFAAEIAKSPGWEIASIGAYFAYVRHPFAANGAAVAETLASRLGLLYLPGSFFGPDQDDYLRIAFANVDEASLSFIAERLNAVAAMLPAR
ncbi:aminotransferase [Acuticoccus sp. M5D2P5]|uniref:aminotransferase n=1 Tax=Acuticoccus kalidii TaxID=2910977 RepID=UPI001F2ADF0D|nr:aminotransferase [Acuticoccus kalidii]MCF3935676.1 aminotransferase [Acuticoccus kalidii]